MQCGLLISYRYAQIEELMVKKVQEIDELCIMQLTEEKAVKDLKKKLADSEASSKSRVSRSSSFSRR